VSTLIHRWGSGLSQVIGTGARDLDEAVGGLATLQALDLLEHDAETTVVIIVAKPPSPAAARAVLERAARIAKPVVACLLGWAGPVPPTLRAVATLEEAAATAVLLAGGPRRRTTTAPRARVPVRPARRLHRRVRGLFTGGTLCEEAARLVGDAGHRFVDFGGPAYTVGRPHPMIDPTLRNRAVAAAGDDPGTAVVVLDLMLGDGAHPDPAAELAEAIREARARARRARRALEVVAHVVGTDEDPQELQRQEATLREAGARTCSTNREAALLARALAGGRRG
jgi:FdrA protein